jgi:hypothetical protein
MGGSGWRVPARGLPYWSKLRATTPKRADTTIVSYRADNALVEEMKTYQLSFDTQAWGTEEV